MNRASRTRNLSGFVAWQIFHLPAHQHHRYETTLYEIMEVKIDEINRRNEIKSYIVRQGMTMQEVVDLLRDEHGWSDSVINLSNKLQRESLRLCRGRPARRCAGL